MAFSDGPSGGASGTSRAPRTSRKSSNGTRSVERGPPAGGTKTDWYTCSPRSCAVRTDTLCTRASASESAAQSMYSPLAADRSSGSASNFSRVPQKPPPSERSRPSKLVPESAATSRERDTPPMITSSMRSQRSIVARGLRLEVEERRRRGGGEDGRRARRADLTVRSVGRTSAAVAESRITLMRNFRVVVAAIVHSRAHTVFTEAGLADDSVGDGVHSSAWAPRRRERRPHAAEVRRQRLKPATAAAAARVATSEPSAGRRQRLTAAPCRERARCASPADSTCSVASRERDFSWSSIYVTPRPLPPTPHTRHHQHAQLADLDARGAQRAARRWCHAQFLAAAATGVFFALGPPALLAACRSSWRAFALALLCWSAGGALPPPPRGSLRAAFAARLVLWAVAAPALRLALGSDHIGGRRALGGATSDAIGLAAACLLLFADGAAAAVPAARAGADGARIEQHLQQERGVLLPIALARLLRRRHRAAREAGALLVAPIAAAAALVGAAAFGAGDEAARVALLAAAAVALAALSAAAAANAAAAASGLKRAPRVGRAPHAPCLSAIGEVSTATMTTASGASLGAPFTSPVLGASPSMGVRAALEASGGVSPAYVSPYVPPPAAGAPPPPPPPPPRPPAAAARCRAAPTVPAAGRGRAAARRGRWLS